MSVCVRQVSQLPELGSLLAASEREGFRFVRRLAVDFDARTNRFDAEGEALFALFDEETCVGVGGVNRDPKGAQVVGRIRRVYVLPEYRGTGAGRMLMASIESWCAGLFARLELYTDTSAAAGFYESQGYNAVRAAHTSHVKKLATSSATVLTLNRRETKCD